MRAIKFKAYDTIQKKWLEPMDKLTICDETDLAWSYLTGSNGNAFIVFNDVAPWIKIVEFTGLLDKNGKEIYEGDIVRAWIDFGPGGEGQKEYAVEISPFGCNLQEWTFKEKGYLPEVIGNIWESAQ